MPGTWVPCFRLEQLNISYFELVVETNILKVIVYGYCKLGQALIILSNAYLQETLYKGYIRKVLPTWPPKHELNKNNT